MTLGEKIPIYSVPRLSPDAYTVKPWNKDHPWDYYKLGLSKLVDVIPEFTKYWKSIFGADRKWYLFSDGLKFWDCPNVKFHCSKIVFYMYM